MKSVAKKVANRILCSKIPNKVWSYSDFKDLPAIAVAKTLSNLSKKNIIQRVEKGLYYLPKKTVLGIVPPKNNILAISRANKKSKFSCISGLSGYNKIGLTTQVPNIITIACDYPVRNKGNVKYILRNKPYSGTEFERIVLDAIRDIDNIPDTTAIDTINKIMNFIKLDKVNINDLGYSAIKEPPKVRAIVGALGQELWMDNKLLTRLKNKINPNTVVYSDVINSLKFAEQWKIKPRIKS